MSLKIDSHDFNQQRGRFRLIFNCRSSEALEEMGWVNVESILLDIKNNLDNVSWTAWVYLHLPNSRGRNIMIPQILLVILSMMFMEVSHPSWHLHCCLQKREYARRLFLPSTFCGWEALKLRYICYPKTTKYNKSHSRKQLLFGKPSIWQATGSCKHCFCQSVLSCGDPHFLPLLSNVPLIFLSKKKYNIGGDLSGISDKKKVEGWRQRIMKKQNWRYVTEGKKIFKSMGIRMFTES